MRLGGERGRGDGGFVREDGDGDGDDRDEDPDADVWLI